MSHLSSDRKRTRPPTPSLTLGDPCDLVQGDRGDRLLLLEETDGEHKGRGTRNGGRLEDPEPQVTADISSREGRMITLSLFLEG